MTNREAIEQLKYIKEHQIDPEDYAVFDLAIKALETTEETSTVKGDLISREALKEAIENMWLTPQNKIQVMKVIDNAPTVEALKDITEVHCDITKEQLLNSLRPQGEYVDISKLRLMTVEECAGHTIDYALGWKACIEWIKKGGAE